MTVLEGPPLEAAEGVGALTLGGFLQEVSGRFANNEALAFDDPLRAGATVRWTYSELAAQSRRVAAGLMSHGAGRGSRVAILMGNRPEAVASFFGAALCGSTAVFLSTFSPPAELDYLLRHSEAEILITQDRLLGRDLPTEVSGVRPDRLRLVAVAGGAGGAGGGHPGTTSWDGLLADGAAATDDDVDRAAAAVSPDDEGTVIYSSGTTERPKGVLHRQAGPALQFWLQARVFGRHEGTRLWTALPLFWTAGLNTAMGATLAAGGCWVMQETFRPLEALRLMERERVTEPYTLPHQTAALTELPEWASADLSAMRCVYGKSAFARHPSVDGDPGWNMPVAYGLSETCSIFASLYSGDGREVMKESTGRLLPGNRLKVVDPETGDELDSGDTGELAVKGPTLMAHYVGMSPEDCFDDDGFFRTGDVGWFDGEGYLHWTGRRSEMIKTAGANVSPAEIEVALRAFPPVKLARVLGRPDPRLGEVAVLCVVLRDGEEATTEADVKDFLRGRLAAYKVPKDVLFLADGEVPMTASDTKVRDAELRRLVDRRLHDRVQAHPRGHTDPDQTTRSGETIDNHR